MTILIPGELIFLTLNTLLFWVLVFFLLN